MEEYTTFGEGLSASSCLAAPHTILTLCVSTYACGLGALGCWISGQLAQDMALSLELFTAKLCWFGPLLGSFWPFHKHIREVRPPTAS